MKNVTIALTEEQHRRLTAAADVIGGDSTIEELIIGNALSRLDGWELSAPYAHRELRHGVHVYAREKRAGAVDLCVSEVNVGIEVCDHELAREPLDAMSQRRPFKIGFEVGAPRAAELRAQLGELEIPESALRDFAQAYVEALPDEYIAEVYVYPNRASAQRVARRLMQKFPGQDEFAINYRVGEAAVTGKFRNPSARNYRPDAVETPAG